MTRCLQQFRWPVFAEAAGVFALPAILFFVLRLRAMAPAVLPDPSIHTSYIVTGRDVFVRYSNAYAATQRLREGARVGFLVPARLAYLAFGGVPGFFVTRYLLALIAVVPVYLLLRRLYCRAAGLVGAITLFSSPVVIAAWGTDYPDSAVVSYLIGGLACLAMPSDDRHRRVWLVCGGILLTVSIWSHSVAVPLVAVIVVAYVAMRWLRERPRLFADMILMASTALTVTGALSIASGVELGQFNFITPTWNAYGYLGTAAQVAVWHTKGWSWAFYLPYLLVPPATVLAWLSVFWRRFRTTDTGSLLIGFTCIGQVLVFGWLQFVGHVQTLEQHYFSSTLWASVVLTLSITLAEAAKPFFLRSRTWHWLPVVVVLAVPLAYEVAPREPDYTWWIAGALLATVLVAGAVMARIAASMRKPMTALLAAALGIVTVATCTLYLTAVPLLRDPHLNQSIDPAPAYSTALGGSVGDLVNIYQVSTELPAFVGNATYKGEQLLMWWPSSEVSTLVSVVGMYHSGFNSLPSAPSHLTSDVVTMIESRKPAEILLLNTSGSGPNASMTALARYHPVLLRSIVLHSGQVRVYARLIDLMVFAPLHYRPR